MAPNMTQKQKKNMKRNAKIKAAKIDANHATLLLELEVRKMLFPSLDWATAETQHALAMYQMEVREMLFPAWDLGSSTITATPVPIVVKDFAASEAASGDEVSLASEKNSSGSNSPSSRSSLSVGDIEDVPVLLKKNIIALLASSGQVVAPMLVGGMVLPRSHRVRDATLNAPGTADLWDGSAIARSEKEYFNAAMLPGFAGMRRSISKVGMTISSSQVRFSAPRDVLICEYSQQPSTEKSGLKIMPLPIDAPVGDVPFPTMTETAIFIDGDMKVEAEFVATKLVDLDESTSEAESFELFSVPLAQIDSSFSDTESDNDDVFEVFATPLSEIDSSFSDTEDECETAHTLRSVVAKKVKKIKAKDDAVDDLDDMIVVLPAITTTPALELTTLFESFKANFSAEDKVKEVKFLGAQCAIGGALFLAGCAGFGAMVGRIIQGRHS